MYYDLRGFGAVPLAVANDVKIALRRVRMRLQEAQKAVAVKNCKAAQKSVDDAFAWYVQLLQARKVAGVVESAGGTQSLLLDIARARIAVGRQCVPGVPK